MGLGPTFRTMGMGSARQLDQPEGAHTDLKPFLNVLERWQNYPAWSTFTKNELERFTMLYSWVVINYFDWAIFLPFSIAMYTFTRGYIPIYHHNITINHNNHH